MSKADLTHEILGNRILHGDYVLKSVPPERELAEEIGISRMTARKAVQRLLDEGLLRREPNGRLIAAPQAGRLPRRFGLFVPSFASMDVESWRLHLEWVAAARGISLQPAMYYHWDDPVLLRGLKALEAIFLYPSCEPLPPRLIKRFQMQERRVVMLEQDFSHHGIPSIRLFPPAFIHRLLDLLLPWSAQGIDCFNVQTVDPTMETRLQQWSLWSAVHRIPGRLWGRPIRPYDTPLEEAYRQMSAILRRNEMNARALLCATAPAAIGAVRALHDHGREVGRDIAVCVINDEGLGRYVTPSITGLTQPDPTPYLHVCFDWLTHADRAWCGSLLLQPAEPSIFRGESTRAPAGDAGLSACASTNGQG